MGNPSARGVFSRPGSYVPAPFLETLPVKNIIYNILGVIRFKNVFIQ